MTIATKAVAGISAVALAGVATFAGVRSWMNGNPPAHSAPSVATPQDDAPDTVPMVTHWHVAYQDATRGQVEGTATVDWEKGHATVRLDEPAAGTSTSAVLTAEDVVIDKTNTTVTMRLRGASPGGERVTPPSPDGMTQIRAGAGQQITITPTEPAFATDVKDRAAADADGVRLTLRATAYGALDGEWSYFADPMTQRNAAGLGREGHYRLLNEDELGDKGTGFLGEQRGHEEWWPLPTEIAAALVVEDQLAATEASFAEYPYPRSLSGPGAANERESTRTLFVIGRHFPVDQGRVLQSFRWADDDNIQSYTVVALSTDPNLDDKGKARIDDGWRKVAQSLEDEAKQLARESLQAAIIVVRLKKGVLPGPKQFGWGEGTSTWFLQFGDNLAEARFVRPVTIKTANDATSRDAFERTPWAFLPERIAVEVETRARLPIASIPVRVTTKGSAAAAAGLGAAVGGASSAAVFGITVNAVQVPGRDKLYRTAPLDLTNGGATGEGRLGVKPRAELLATVQVDDVAFVAPPLAHALVLLTPDQLAQRDGTTPAAGTDSSTVKLWKEALVLAAKADGKPITDFDQLPGTSLKPYHDIPMTIADHAAMLLVRSAFLDMLRERLQFLDAIKSDDDVDAFREWVRPFMEPAGPVVPSPEPPVGWEKYPDYLKVIEDINNVKGFLLSLPGRGGKAVLDAAGTALNSRPKPGFGKGTYFGDLPVPNRRGTNFTVMGVNVGTWEYYQTYASGNDAEFREWRQRATRSVIAQYRGAVAATIAKVQGIPDSDTKELLKWTGLSFGAVANTVIPQLMRLDDSGASPQWVVDRPARAAVANLLVFAAAVRASEDFSGAAMHAPISIISDLLMVHGLIGSSATALTRVAGWGLLAWSAGSEIYDQVMVRRDLDDFFGASTVLGADRLEELYGSQSSISDVLSQLAGQFAFDSAWGALGASGGPIAAPTQGAMRLALPGEATLLAANQQPGGAIRRVRSFRSRLFGALGAISAERTMARVSRVKLTDLKLWPKQQLQWFLQLAGRGGHKIDAGRPVAREQVEAVFEARRLKNEIDDPTLTLARASFGEPPPDPRPPAGGALGLPGVGGAQAPPRKVKAGPYLPTVGLLRRDLPWATVPAMEKAWIAIQEAGQWVYFRTTGFDPTTQKPERLGSGASSDVHLITDVAERPRNILDGDGAVIKVLKDHPDFGTAKEQIRRMQESYENLKAAKSRGLAIEAPQILEFHPDAVPPYLIQRRLNFNTAEYRQVDVQKLFVNGQRVDWAIVNKEFPLQLRIAVVELYAGLGRMGLISTDLSLPNLYFRNVGGRWVAGILDIDHLVMFSQPGPVNHKTWDYIREIRNNQARLLPSIALDGRSIDTSPLTFMEKMLELPYGGHWGRGWLRFSRGRFVAGLIEPELVEKVFSKFRVRPKAASPKTQGWLDRMVPWFTFPQPTPLPATA